PRRAGRGRGAVVLAGHEAAAGDRRRAARRPRPAGARRADERPRPAGHPAHARADPRARGTRRPAADRRRVVASAGRGRADLRLDHRGRSRPARLPGPAGRAAGRRPAGHAAAGAAGGRRHARRPRRRARLHRRAGRGPGARRLRPASAAGWPGRSRAPAGGGSARRAQPGRARAGDHPGGDRPGPGDVGGALHGSDHREQRGRPGHPHGTVGSPAMTTQDASKPADARSAAERPGRWTDDLVDNQIGRAGREGHPWPERSTRDGRLVAVGRSFQSEARKLRRGGTFLAMGGLAALAVLSSVLSFALAKNGLVEAGRGPELSVPTLQELATPGGLVLGFRIGLTFTGLLLMVLCAATTATEYAQGTIRAIFMREPRRVAWLAGRMGALLGLLVVALVGAFMLSAGTSVLMAELRNVPTDQWWTADALRQAGKDYLNVLVA